jgi:imidazole glycerol-phosphate synthase subunit HisH
MTGNRITIVDYGVGNLYSVQRAVEVCGGKDICVSSKPEDIENADRVVLPGVGAFEDGMRGLRERGLIAPIIAYGRSGRPLLGICLGMQMLATVSEEFGMYPGLDMIPGVVKAIPRKSTDGEQVKVPFIGWTPIVIENPQVAIGSCLESHPDSAAVYLVHSFQVMPKDPAHLLASYLLGGHRIAAAICKDNITGLQFHPEKSGDVGLAIMRRFVAQPQRS